MSGYGRRSAGGGKLVAVAILAALLAAFAKDAGHGTAVRHGGAGGAAGYVNPLAGQRWTLARTDQGVDYRPDVPEPVRAIGDGVVVYSSTADCPPSGWPACAVIGYKLTDGPEAGHVIYVAEHLSGLLPRGASFKAGQRIATALPGYPWTEWGWADCTGSAPAVHYNGAADGTPMPGGLAFARFMRGLGAATAQDPGPGPDAVRSC
jgi:murein DD-endopeptidase MepM/ murein hydrolase activator NlpD